MTQGWTVEVTAKASGGGEAKQVFGAHIPDRSAAEQAVAKRAAATPDAKVEAKFDKGVLKVTAAKKPEAVKAAERKIEGASPASIPASLLEPPPADPPTASV